MVRRGAKATSTSLMGMGGLCPWSDQFPFEGMVGVLGTTHYHFEKEEEDVHGHKDPSL